MNRYAIDLPKIGIRPCIDGRRNGVREGLEVQTMNMAKAAAKLMRKLSETTGMNLGDGFQEALRRLEADVDPDKIDEEMGDILSSEDPFGKKRGRKAAAFLKPRKDETLYDL